MTPTKKPLPIALVVLPALVGAFILGRISVSSEPQRALNVDAPSNEEQKPKLRTVELTPASKSTVQGRRVAKPRTKQPAKTVPSMPLADALKVARAAFAAPNNLEVQETAKLAAGGLYVHLKTNPADLARSLTQLSSSNRQDEADFLASVLGRIHDPIVEKTALELAERGPDASKAAAFDILDAFDTPAALIPALRALSSNQSVQVRRAALRAIPKPEGLDHDTANEVVKQLTETLKNDEDPEARRRAALLLGDWQRSIAEFWPVIEALSQDQDINVRAGCAFACEISGLKDSRVINVLAGVLSRVQEDPLVRENAWRALGRLSPLPKTAELAYEKYKRELEEAGVGEDGGAG
ncbi:MAG: HEAT repeat domain-containing protein [Planctomycetota bacterium]|nr:HEAT repeat domain-containing protein [Planctomycetota bacterium]